MTDGPSESDVPFQGFSPHLVLQAVAPASRRVEH
jgi:hypothetical protein